MLPLFLTTEGLRMVSLILRTTERYGFDPAGRGHWPADDPILLSKAFFAIVHIFSFARIIFLFQDAEGKMVDLKSAQATVTVGEILLMIYHAMAIIVLFDKLNAMMSNSFHTIQAS
ncbi:unnamed protein product [Taenia asiatica]|uniref:Ion_trans domain-containing protein n=1 Tax=Taenia asiatica TaxID=60517 RepID=A0A0R3WCV9_TAEAS|nr:unnamed protein product [Taenia asiatica]